MKMDDSPAQRAVLAALRRICAKLPSAEEYVMVHHPAFRVGKKPFAIAGMQQGSARATLSINLGPDMQHQLLDDARFAKTPYIGQHGWVTIAHADLGNDELELLVRESWRRIANKKQLAQLAAPAEALSAPAKKKSVKRTAARRAAAKR